MKLGIPKERRDSETRVAATPDTVKRLTDLGFQVSVEKGAGALTHISDDQYKGAGAKIAASHKACVSGADVIFKVRGPEAKDLKDYKKGAIVAAIMNPYQDGDLVSASAEAGVISMAMEFMPRITRAQSMDVLSSQSNLAGYKAVIDAAAELDQAMPMMMTAAGTVAPAKIFIMGAGVAGLQAIATAKRLGAVVTATDVRPAAKEQVESLGGKFIAVEGEEFKQAETAAGYAKPMSEEYQQKQAELVAGHIAKQDIVITTALIPGRAAPVLVSEDMVKSMKAGSIIVDLAVEAGGNCPLSEVGQVVVVHGVSIMGHANVAGRLPVDSSALYARNLLNFITPLVDAERGELALDFEDEILAGVTLTRDGEIIHPALTEK